MITARKKLAILISLIVIPVILIIAGTVCLLVIKNNDNVGVIAICVENEERQSFAVTACEQPIQFGYNLSKDKKASSLVVNWYIEGESYDSTISDDGLFVAGIIAGTVNVNVDITYKGEVRTQTLIVEIVSRGLQSIAVSGNVQTEYIEGQTFDSDGLIVVGTFANGTAVVSGYTILKDTPLGTSDTGITITYTENGDTASVNLPVSVARKTLQNITVVTQPTKLNYIEGEVFSANGIVVKANYEYLWENVTDFTVSKTTALNTADLNITISYTDNGVAKSAVVAIYVAQKTLQSITISTMPLKLNYIEGQTFSENGLVLTANYEFLNQTITDYTFDKITPLMPEDTSITFSYSENGVIKTVSQTITVARRTLQSIEISTLPGTTAYIEGHTFDAGGMVVTAHYEHKSLIVTNYTVDTTTPFENVSDTQRIVSYTENGITKTTVITVFISENLLQSIEVMSPANKLLYSCGEMLNTLGLVISANYTNGTQGIVVGWTVNKTIALTVADDLVVVTYVKQYSGGQVTKSCNYEIAVSERTLESIAIITQPSKTNYVEGEYFCADGLEVIAVYSGETAQNVLNYTLSINRALQVGDNEIIVAYIENTITKTARIQIEVAQRVLTDIQIVANPVKTEYKTSEYFDSNGLIVRAIYNNGAYCKIVVDYLIDKNAPLVTSDEIVIVSYFENGQSKTANVEITVTSRTLESIEITCLANKLLYTQGDYFDISGLEITAIYADSADCVITAWTYDKQNALSPADLFVTISYTESGITKILSFDITVNAQNEVDEDVLRVINVIAALPQTQNLILENKLAIEYAQSLFDALTVEQKTAVTNEQKLADAVAKMAQLLEEAEPEIEPEYTISYAVYGLHEFADFDFGDNITLYKNSDGQIMLNDALSQLAAQNGYQFVRWVDNENNVYTSILNLSSNITFYAVFELTQTVNIIFKDYVNKTNTVYTMNNVTRSADFELTNAVMEAIFVATDKLAVSFYVENSNNQIIKTDGSFSVNYNAEIVVYVVLANCRTITLPQENEATISYIYLFDDDNFNTQSFQKEFATGTSFDVPTGATVSINLLNPLITDVNLDGEPVGLVYVQREYSFVLLTGENPLEITFVNYVAESVSIGFEGLNNRVYTYVTSDWNGKLLQTHLDDIAFVYDESNLKYLNRYHIGETTLLFEELGNYEFVGNTLVSVERIENTFDITFECSDSSFVLTNLVGRQAIGLSIAQAGLNANLISVYDAIFEKLSIYSDNNRQSVLTQNAFELMMLLDNLKVYVAGRTTFFVTIESFGGNEVAPFAVIANLSENMPEIFKAGFILSGFSETIDGSVLSLIYIDTIIQNLNQNVTLYAVWDIDPHYVEPLEPVEYVNHFVGNWTALYNNEYGIVSATLNLYSDGTYCYIAYVNGIMSVNLSGEYRFENNKLAIYSLIMAGEFDLISKAQLDIDISFAADNIIVAPMFVVDGLQVDCYVHYLTKGQVKPTNYGGSTVVGEYSLLQTETIDNVKSTQITTIELFANGASIISIEVLQDENIVYCVQEEGYYRITDAGIIFIGNGHFGILDISNLLMQFVKKGTEYSGVAAVGIWAANDNVSSDFAQLIKLTDTGMLYLFSEANSAGINYLIVSTNQWVAQIGYFVLNVELLDENNIRIIITDIDADETEILKYIRVEGIL